ncbi:MAG: adenylate/guanylate cyclase domain-containing protein [Chloroflexi bacterium]|nr:adenylate/guanylate cyclase domain-containing protein [Chloroflexota bacterium]
MSSSKRFLAGIAVASAIGIAFSVASTFNLFQSLQRNSSDLLFKAAAASREAEPEETIVIVAIDDRSLDELGHLSQWPRSHYSQVLDKISESEARVVVFDVLFSESAPGDEELAHSIRNAGNVVLPAIQTTQNYGSVTARGVPESNGLIRPVGTLLAEASATGLANVAPDDDGIVRRLLAVSNDGDSPVPALALVAAAKYLRRPAAIEAPVENNRLLLAGRQIPLSNDNKMIINYIDGSKGDGVVNFRTLSFVDVIGGNVGPELFKDKIVFIGATASGLGDIFWTPAGWSMNGVEVHASAVQTILKGNFLKQVIPAVTILSILLLTLVCGLAVLRLGTVWSLTSTIVLCAFYFLIAFFLFDAGIMLDMFYPPLAMAATFAGVNLYNVNYERSEKKEITRTFGRYVSPVVADRVLESMARGDLKLGGNQQEVTVLFADVRGFTAISEAVAAERLVKALNTYFSAIIKAILEHGGMVNKFGGDSIMAVWNVPIECKAHAISAIMAAVNAQSAIKKLHIGDENLPEMQFGIGINTGKAIAGNIGTEARLEYSVIGDAVNVANRLAGSAPGGAVWIGAETFEQARNHITVKSLEPLTVKGKREPLEAYEVLGIHDFQPEDSEMKKVKRPV